MLQAESHTFPFPRSSPAERSAVAHTGEALYDHRSSVMLACKLGMTKVWNLLLDPDCLDDNIVELRRLRDNMDRAILAAYAWADLDPDDKDEILRRLRKLNAERAAEEARGA